MCTQWVGADIGAGTISYEACNRILQAIIEEVDQVDQEELKAAVREAVVEGLAAVLGAGDQMDDVSPVGTARIGEGDRSIYTRQPTPYVDFDTANLRSIMAKFDADVEVTRQELVTAAQEMTAAQSRGALKELKKRVEVGFDELSDGLNQAVARVAVRE